MSDRDDKGRFKLGYSGNPNGRPINPDKKRKLFNSRYREQYVTRDSDGRFSSGSSGNPGINGNKLYIIWHEGDFYKIGICKNAKSRFAMLQSNTPYKAEMIYLRKVVNAIDIEHDIKEMFAEKHVRGEWYRFTESDLEYIQRYVEDISSTPIKVEQPELFTLLKGMKNGT